MLFSSIFFLFFFLPFVILLNFLSARSIKIQNFILMMFSLFFYYWGERDHIIIMLGCIVVNYIAAILIDYSNICKIKRLYLLSAIILSLSMLGYFKYFNFFIDNINWIVHSQMNFAKIVLPLGISFYTFHALSYVIDVYWGKIKSEKNLITFICYVSLFPQLVAGPIVRYRDISHSFYARFITRAGFRNGILRFSFGLGKKILIANTIAVMADRVFALPVAELNFSVAWAGAIAYMLQIYFDFSGYSDMAIGIGLMLGFKYKENFNFPYRALSIQDFWRRWHISLSSWFRDYVYIPLGGNKKSEIRTYFNLVTIFVLCGFWHGANYTFIAWGLFYGVFLVFERTKLGGNINKLPKIMRHIYVLIIVLFAWVLFRVDRLHMAKAFYRSMLIPSSFNITPIADIINPAIISAYILGSILALGFNSYLKDFVISSHNKTMILAYKQINIVMGAVVLLVSLLPMSSNSYSPFLYFRF
jgi:alginate O-acetyltransferase complex protein AlgI